MDSRPPHGEDPHQDLLTEKNRLPLYRPLLDLDLVSHLCVHRSSTCVIVLVGLSDSLVSSPRVSPRVLHVLSWDPLLS